MLFGKVAVRANSNMIGICFYDRHWGNVKHLNSGKRSHISKEKTEKQSMVYTKARLNKAKFHRSLLEKLNDAYAAWGDEDKKFNLGLEKFGVDVDYLNITAVSKRYFHCWLEDWEKPLLKKNDPVSR